IARMAADAGTLLVEREGTALVVALDHHEARTTPLPRCGEHRWCGRLLAVDERWDGRLHRCLAPVRRRGGHRGLPHDDRALDRLPQTRNGLEQGDEAVTVERVDGDRRAGAHG